MKNLKDIILERLVLSKDKQPNKYITFKELALYKMRDFNNHSYGDGFNTDDWCTPENIYHGGIKPYNTKDRQEWKSFTTREVERMLPELSKFYKEHEDDEFLIDDIRVKGSETPVYNVFNFEIENYIFNWIIYKRTFNI
jgi:hypothetical protein